MEDCYNAPSCPNRTEIFCTFDSTLKPPGELFVRLPTFFNKKRGNRRTGLPVWGSLGEGIYHAVLLVAGLIIGVLMLAGIAVPEWRINNQFVGVNGRLIGKGLARHTLRDVFGGTKYAWRPALLVQYDVDGVEVESWDTVHSSETHEIRDVAVHRLDDLKLGDDVRCWYDPNDIETVVLKRGYSWWLWLLTLLLPGALVTFGATGLIHFLKVWGRSEERQAAQFGRLLETLASPLPESVGFPTIPACDNLVNSPGMMLRFRLPTESPELWSLIGAGLFSGLWNVVVVLLAVNVGFNVAEGRADWWLLGLLAPFAIVGVASIGLFCRQLFFVTAVGPTHVEISDHPLCPGDNYQVLLSQAGSASFQKLELFLELEEQATFRQGTDVRTERQIVWQFLIRCWKDVEPLPGTPFEAEVQLQLPSEAMHSFHSTHNAVSWRLVLRGVPKRWPALVRVFPVVVFPADGMKSTGKKK